MAATIKDIAKQLNISVSTVSYALNGGPRSVPDAVREQVRNTAKTLGYRPNRIARSMVTGRTNTIGVVPSMLGHNIGLGPYFQQALNGIINEAEALEHDVLLFTRFDQSQSELIQDDLLDGRVDALIFLAPPEDSIVIPKVAEHGIPTIVLGSDKYPQSVAYIADNAGGVRSALSHLYDLGHRNFGHLSGKPELTDSRQRENAFRSFLAEKGLCIREEWIVDGDFTATGGYTAATQLFKLPKLPTAFFCANDEMAIGLMMAAHERGLSIPRDFSLVGFDDIPSGQFCIPPLTTVRQPISEIAVMSLRAAVGLASNAGPFISRQFSTELIVRASTSCPQEDNHE